MCFQLCFHVKESISMYYRKYSNKRLPRISATSTEHQRIHRPKTKNYVIMGAKKILTIKDAPRCLYKQKRYSLKQDGFFANV